MSFIPFYRQINLTNSRASMEAIDFQVGNKLGPRLTALFQSVIDYRDNIDYSLVANNVTDRRAYRIRTLFDYFSTTAVPEFQKIVFEETGLKISKVFCIGGIEVGVVGYFACDLSFDNIREALTNINTMTGTSEDRYTTCTEMRELTELFDLTQGKLRNTHFGKDKRREIATNMYFDVNTAFLSNDFLSNVLTEPLTAEEIASIMMHEIGHALTFIEHCADMYVTSSRLSNKFNELLKASKHKENEETPSMLDGRAIFYNFYNTSVPIIKNIMKQIKGEDKTRVMKLCNTAMTLLNNTKKAVDDYYSEPDGESIFRTIGVFIVNVLLMTYVVVFTSIAASIMDGGMSILMAYIADLEKYNYTNERAGNKSSDAASSMNNVFLLERWADEFVSRHGYGDALSSALNKMHTYFDRSVGTGSIGSDRLRRSYIYGFIIMVFVFTNKMTSVFRWMDPAGYENQYHRLLRVLQNTYGFFKKTNVPAPVLDQWMNKIEYIKKEAANAKSIGDTAVGEAFVGIIKNIIVPYRWYTLLATGNLDKDIATLANHVDDFTNNPFYYQSYRLRS